MFAIDSNKLVTTDSPRIVDEYEVILWEEETPILFTGTNPSGRKIIGSSVDEDLERGIERFFHAVVQKPEFQAFVNRIITLRSIYEKADPLFVVDKTSSLTTFYAYKLSQVPENYWPSESSYVPLRAHVETVLSGNRQFSSTRLQAMMAYLKSKITVSSYQTKVYKLLFYSDMTAFYLNGKSISGSRYINLPYGPVPEHGFDAWDDSTLNAGTSSDYLSQLEELDIRVLDWVLDTYGKLTTTEITNLSHTETGYLSTRPGETIPYTYARYLKKLPRF